MEKSKKGGKDQESIQSSTTPDPGYQWESDNFTIRHHKRESRGQPFPQIVCKVRPSKKFRCNPRGNKVDIYHIVGNLMLNSKCCQPDNLCRHNFVG